MSLSKLFYHNFPKPIWRIKSTIIFLLNNLGLWKIFKIKINFAPQMTRSDRLMCMIPHQCIGSPLSSLFLIRLFGGAQDREWKEAYMFRIYCKVKNRTQQRKQVIQSDQGVHVCGIFLDGTRTLFCMTLSLFWDMGYLFFFLFFSFSPCFWARIYFFFSFA